ncbi:hypothetical protein [Anaerococcus nagyae]|jgi:membrane protein|uniref:hypothetical protein n=1 Tax=Anaerococcus nagyae TaxID=1755241 RepID=UPI003247BD17
MSGAIRVLKADLKENIKNFSGAIVGLLIGIGFLSLFLAKIVMGREGISYGEFLQIILVVMMLFCIGVTLALGQAYSISDTYPIANKLGNKRSDIAIGLILKDIIIFTVTGLFMYIFNRLILSNVKMDTLEQLGKVLDPNFVISFVIGISSVSLIGSTIAYILKVTPVTGSLLGIVFAFALFINGNIINILYIDNICFVLVLLLLSQILRYFIITKLDTRF